MDTDAQELDIKSLVKLDVQREGFYRSTDFSEDQYMDLFK